MIINTITVSNCQPQTIVIGRRGTYDTMQIAFDLSYLVESYGNGVAVLAVKRSQDESAYPAVTSQEDDLLLWTVSETDTHYVGAGECQLMWYVDGGLAKTIIYPMVVMRDILATSEEAPDAYQEWVDALIAEGAETLQNAQDAAQSASDAETAKDDAVTAKEAAEDAQEAAETAVTHYPKIENNYWMVWDSTSQSYVSTGIQAEGEDGYSPEVTITSITGGHRVTITDKDHPQGQSFDVMDGEDGASDAGEVTFDPTQTYPDGSLGKVVSNELNAIDELDDALTEETEVPAGGSVEFTDSDSFYLGNGNIRWFTNTFGADYQVDSVKIRAYKNANAGYKFKIAAVSYEGTFVYVRRLSEEITLAAPSGTYQDYEINLDAPFVIPAGMRIAIVASDVYWFGYSESGDAVTYVNRTDAYANIAVDYRLMTYLPTVTPTGLIPVTFYSQGKEIKHIYTAAEIAEIAKENGTPVDDTLTIEGDAADAKATGDAIALIQNEMDVYSNLVTEKNTSESKWQVGQWDSSSTATIGANTRYISYKEHLDDVDLIINHDITQYKFGIVAHDFSSQYPGMGYYDVENDQFVRYQYLFITSQTFDLSALRSKYPNYQFSISVRKLTETDMSTSLYQCVGFISYNSYGKAYIDSVVPKTVYVAPTGNDENSGENSSSSLLTINHALETGATRILLAGGSYSEQIDIGKAKKRRVSIEAADPTNSPVIYAPGCKIAETESSVSGYSKVYSASTEHTFPDTTSRIFLEGVPDATTEILDDDRHSLQRGNYYRCDDTAIYKCSATSLNDALTEIENSDQYKWFYSSGTIYFSRPQAVSASHPLMTGLYANPLFANTDDRGSSIEISGVIIKYARVNLDSFSSAKMSNCKVFGGCGGGIIYNNSLSLVLERCDVSRSYSGGLGDGIAATGSNSYGQAYGTTVTMIDCWVHDNNDDGFSDHIGCESTIIGGLYEYNGKAGVLPTGGGNCTCYNTMCRKNAIGFEIAGGAGAVASGRNGQQIECSDCIADGNSQYGFFVAGNQDMTMRLYNCIALNNGTGFIGPHATTGSILLAVNCSGYGNTTLKGQDVTVVETTHLS